MKKAVDHNKTDCIYCGIKRLERINCELRNETKIIRNAKDIFSRKLHQEWEKHIKMTLVQWGLNRIQLAEVR